MFNWLKNLFREKELTDTQKSALLLDKRHPGWDKKIDLNTLSMYDANNCVLAQLYGGYTKGLDEIGLANGHEEYNFVMDDAGWSKEVLARR